MRRSGSWSRRSRRSPARCVGLGAMRGSSRETVADEAAVWALVDGTVTAWGGRLGRPREQRRSRPPWRASERRARRSTRSSQRSPHAVPAGGWRPHPLLARRPLRYRPPPDRGFPRLTVRPGSDNFLGVSAQFVAKFPLDRDSYPEIHRAIGSTEVGSCAGKKPLRAGLCRILSSDYQNREHPQGAPGLSFA